MWPGTFRLAEVDGRLHSLIDFGAATGRTTSSELSLQNVPHDPRFRALFKARPGHQIIAADYGAIQLRIAAVLAERAVSDARRRIAEGQDQSWFIKQVLIGASSTRKLGCPQEPDKWSLDWSEQAIPSVAQVVLCRVACDEGQIGPKGTTTSTAG